MDTAKVDESSAKVEAVIEKIMEQPEKKDEKEVEIEVKDEEVKEDEDDIPENFFDDFSNNEFMDGLNVLDSWDENQTQDKKKSPKPDVRKPRRVSPARRSPYRNRPVRGSPPRRGRFYQSAPRKRRSISPLRNRPRDEDRSNKYRKDEERRDPNRKDEERRDKNRKDDQRRDPNKNRNDVQRDKDKVKRMLEAKEVEKTVQVAETGLCPPGMEDMIDEVQFNPMTNKKSKERIESRKRSQERKKSRDVKSKERRRSPPHRRSRHSNTSDRETWLRNRSSVSPQSKRSRMETYERQRRRRSSDRFNRRTRSKSRERPPRKRSPFLHELARTLCGYQNAFPPNFTQYPVMDSFPMDVPQIVSPQIIPPQIVPPVVNDGFNFPSVQSFPPMEQFAGVPFSQEQVIPGFVPFMNMPRPEEVIDLESGNLQSPVKKESFQTSTLEISKLFEDKKISLSDFLSVSAKGETLPNHVQEKIKVISRCQEAIKVLDNIGKFSGRFCPKPTTKCQESPTNQLWKSPLKRQAVIKFKYTSVNKRRDQEIQQTMKKLLHSINLKDELLPIAPDPPKIHSQDYHHVNAFMQTDPYKCQSCEDRKSIVYCTIETQTNTETVSQGTQVTPSDLVPPTPTRGILKNSSITHLTAAQLRAKRNPSPPSLLSETVYNPFVGTNALLATPVMRPQVWNNSPQRGNHSNSPMRGMNPWGDRIEQVSNQISELTQNAAMHLIENLQQNNWVGNNSRSEGRGGRRRGIPPKKNSNYHRSNRTNIVDLSRRYP